MQSSPVVCSKTLLVPEFGTGLGSPKWWEMKGARIGLDTRREGRNEVMKSQGIQHAELTGSLVLG